VPHPAAPRIVDVSVIVVNYNVREYLANALRSLRASLQGVRSEVIVVDNASADGSVEMIRKQFPRVRLIVSDENSGFAHANNLALRKAKGRYLLLLNPDTLVREDTVRVMRSYLEKHPEVGLAGCKILNPDGTFQLAARRSFPTPWTAFTRIVGLSRLFPSSKLFGRYNLTYRSVEESYEVDAVSGSFMFLRRDVYEKVGGLDEAFFMYGEDLDWCYRIQRAGWKINYVHATSIIHYKGESTRRSNLDEIRTFYEAMQVFVGKHFKYPKWLLVGLKISIRAASAAAFVLSHFRRLWPAVIDALVVDCAIIASEYLRRGGVFLFPDRAYPTVYIIPSLIVVATLLSAGVYTRRSMSVTRSWTAVVVAFIFLSALTAFFKEYAFSRIMVVIAGILSSIAIPGWRMMFRIMGRSRPGGRSTLFGRRTVVVGTGPEGQAVAERLRARITDGIDVIGLIAAPGSSSSGTVAGLPVLGTVESIGKVLRSHKVTDVVVAPGVLTNTQLFAMIGGNSGLPVSFQLVPGTMEVLIGKASVESLERVALVEVAYNIELPSRRIAKRVFDVTVAAALLITVYPFVYLLAPTRKRRGSFLRNLPDVLSGRCSLVGPTAEAVGYIPGLFLGKPGLTGLIQLHAGRPVSREEIEQFLLSYARNQSVLLDLEILFKSFILHRRRRRIASAT